MTKSFREWLAEGEQLYAVAMQEVRAIESQLEVLEAQLTTKRAETNEIARVVGKPPVEANRRLTAQLVEAHVHAPSNVPSQPANAARVLSGRPVIAR